VVTIVGAKGRAGKTVIAVNLAVALRQLTAMEVAVVDADQRFGAVAAMLGLSSPVAPPPPHEHGGIDNRRVARSLVRHRSGVDVLARDTGADDDRILDVGTPREITGALANNHDFAIVDAPGEMTDLAAAYSRAAETVLLVTALDVFNLKDTAAAVAMLDSWRVPPARVELIVNNATRAPSIPAAVVASATGLSPSLTIPYDSRVPRSLEAGIPIVMSHPRSDFARHIYALAERVAGLPAGSSNPRGGILRSLLRRTG
jgi:pilus assembly protein CpaE